MRRQVCTLLFVSFWIPAAADPITVSGADVNALLVSYNAGTEPIETGSWRVTFYEDSFENLEALLAEQIWWDELFVAQAFADLVGEVEGVDNLGLGLGPIFLSEFGLEGNLLWSSWSDGSRFPEGAGPYTGAHAARVLVYATAELVSVSEPGTWGLLGTGLVCMVLARQRKRLI